MSRIGHKPIPLPAGVKAGIEPGAVRIEGPKGKLTVVLPPGIRVEQKDSALVALRENDEQKALHGLARALVANGVLGVSQGFQKELNIVGVGYRAEVKGQTLVLSLGYSHPVEFPIPEGIRITVDKQTHLVVSGADKCRVGQVAAEIHRFRPPDPYKQKGVQIVGQRLKKKAGKAGIKAAGAG
jgi:large subunit ribosomal protein L6